MEIQEIKNREIWKNFLFRCDEKTFLDSWNWGEFQKMIGNQIRRLGIYKKQKLISVALTIKIEAKRGTFLFLPHGPVFEQSATSDKRQVFKILLEKLKKIAKKEEVSFIRVAPILKRSKENIEIFKNTGFKAAPIHIHPELTWQLDITPSEDKLLMGMRKTARYLIKKGLKNKEIEITQSQNLEHVKIFNELYQRTAARHGFVPFSLDYLKNEFLAFEPDNQILIFLGKYKNELISSAVITFWQEIAFYHHGASSLEYSKIPVSYRLQWEAILEAKNRGCKLYNFWGIAPTENKNHPWAGLTLFKKGFGGYKKEYVKTQDLVLSPKYWLTYLFEKLRKTKRGL